MHSPRRAIDRHQPSSPCASYAGNKEEMLPDSTGEQNKVIRDQNKILFLHLNHVSWKTMGKMPSKFRGKIISNLEFYDLTTLTKLRIKTEGHRYFQTQKFSKTVSSISFSGRSRRLCSTQMRKGSQKDSGGDPRKRMQRRGGDKVAV